MEIDRCPQLMLGAETKSLIQLADMYRKGLPPLAGGTLDQPQWFLDWCSAYWRDLDAVMPPKLFGV